MDEVDEARIARLCPDLRRIVEAEISAGNWVAETWEGWGLVIMLGAPFRARHASDELDYRDVDDPHYWKSEYHCKAHHQRVACRFDR
jgi:hypothetical protein